MLLRLLLLCFLRTITASYVQRIRHEPTYFVAASGTVRPGQVFGVVVMVFRGPLSVRASVQREGGGARLRHRRLQASRPGDPAAQDSSHESAGGVPSARGRRGARGVGGQRLLQRDRAATGTDRTLSSHSCDHGPARLLRGSGRLHLGPTGTIMRRWLSRQTNLGAVSLQYQLSSQPRFGNWTIRVVAQGQVEEKTIYVEEYYQTPFEVNVTLPAFILESERSIRCTITAKYVTRGILF
ncbi:CD109 antigen [Caerostris extrusa]|uniref:CD109 antigen n=1 Tax=Caerostris extrusa TaxID=172846 RepID=A0AAV4PSJ8_CAEEX|nr:CD109 antigen [Caerostris extrusa]